MQSLWWNFTLLNFLIPEMSVYAEISVQDLSVFNYITICMFKMLEECLSHKRITVTNSTT